MKRANALDKLIWGLVSGIILPIITLLIIWQITFDDSLGEYLNGLHSLNNLASLLSLVAIPNLLLFFICIWMNIYRAARGVIFATFVLAFLMLIIKYF